MAIPFLLPDQGPTEDYQDLDRLLGDLFHVLTRILAQRGESVAVLSTGAVTIRRPSRQLRLQVSGQTQVDDEADIIEVSSSEDSSSDIDSSVPPSPTSPTAPMPIPELPDLVSNLPGLAECLPAETLPGVQPEPEEQAVRARALRSRSRKPRSPRKARSPRGSKAKRAAANLPAVSAPSKDVTRTASTRGPKAAPTVC